MVRCEKLIRLQFERVSLVRVWFVTIAGERIVQSIVGYLCLFLYMYIYNTPSVNRYVSVFSLCPRCGMYETVPTLVVLFKFSRVC